MFEAASRIMDDFYDEDIKYKYHEKYFIIYPTKRTQSFFDTIYVNEIKNKSSISSFIRRLLNEYAYLPQFVRENIAKRCEGIELHKAAINNKVVIFDVSNTTYKVAPFALIPNREEKYSYLLGLDLNSRDKKPISIKLSKIYNIITTKEKYSLSKPENDLFNKIISRGVEFASSDLVAVKIKLSKTGIKLLNLISHNRPLVEKIDEDNFIIYSSISNFMNYFIQFGKELTIINNDELKEKLYRFHFNASKHLK